MTRKSYIFYLLVIFTLLATINPFDAPERASKETAQRPLRPKDANLKIPYNDHDNIFIKYVHRVIRRDSDIILFNGPSVKGIFGNVKIRLGEKSSPNNWNAVSKLINQEKFYKNSTMIEAVHIHNELKFGNKYTIIIRSNVK
jgi:hypothetical protein